jgi:hypothetical protein
MRRNTLNAADRKVLRLAIDEIDRAWAQAELNLDVMARAADGEWNVSPAIAKRRHRTLMNRRASLTIARAKLGL